MGSSNHQSALPHCRGKLRGDTAQRGTLTNTSTKVLAPLPAAPIIYGIGLNYKTHIAEAKWPTPPNPSVFTKPPRALNGPFADVHIHPDCAQTMDYEGELAVIIGREIKNAASEAEALDAVLGYAAANDVSSRQWQMPEVSGGQHGYAKSFDGFAPLGPVITAAGKINPAKPGGLKLVTRVNGEGRQRVGTDDLLFGVGQLIMHLSRGATLDPGTVILTGTPGGVAAFMEPKAWLKDGDVVEVEIEGIGRIRNKYVFEQ